MPRMYSTGTLFVDVDWVGEDLRISGQDLAPPAFMGDEYEYWITVPASSRAALAAALGVADDGDVLLATIVARGEEICLAGERTWLTDHGVATEFASY